MEEEGKKKKIWRRVRPPRYRRRVTTKVVDGVKFGHFEGLVVEGRTAKWFFPLRR